MKAKAGILTIALLLGIGLSTDVYAEVSRVSKNIQIVAATGSLTNVYDSGTNIVVNYNGTNHSYPASSVVSVSYKGGSGGHCSLSVSSPLSQILAVVYANNNTISLKNTTSKVVYGYVETMPGTGDKLDTTGDLIIDLFEIASKPAITETSYDGHSPTIYTQYYP